jgi:hypothetical protein
MLAWPHRTEVRGGERTGSSDVDHLSLKEPKCPRPTKTTWMYGKRAVWWSLLAVLISVLIVACAYYELRPMINGQPVTEHVDKPAATQ